MMKLKNVIAVLGAAALTLSGLFAVIPASADNSTLNESTSVRTYKNDTSSFNVSELTSFDSAGNVQNIGVGKSHADIAAELTGIGKGEAAAAKNAYFEKKDDAKKGIVKTDLDIADNSVEKPIDVAIVLDDSGSMNMYR